MTLQHRGYMGRCDHPGCKEWRKFPGNNQTEGIASARAHRWSCNRDFGGPRSVIRTFCPKHRGTRGPASGDYSCSWCGQQGHAVKDCPKARRSDP